MLTRACYWCGALTLCAALIAAVFTAPVCAASRTVTFRTDDGVTLTGTWYEPSTRPAPAVILVHMLRRTRHDWDGLAAALASQGIGALAFDLRGHGDSQGTLPEDAQFAAFEHDVAAARRFVALRPDVSPARIGMAGASLGASLVVLNAAQMPGIASLALLSATTEYRGLRIDAAFRKYAGRALLVAGDDDAYAERSVKELIKAAGGPGGVRESLSLPNAGVGTAMLTRDPGLSRALVDWFKRTLQ